MDIKQHWLVMVLGKKEFLGPHGGFRDDILAEAEEVSLLNSSCSLSYRLNDKLICNIDALPMLRVTLEKSRPRTT